MLAYRAAQVLMAGGLLLAAAGGWMKDVPPDPERLSPGELDEPVQKAVRKPPFETQVNGVTYRIQPRYSYELNAVVVSLHHSDTWWDYAHREWGDHVNVMDLCVVWGDSVRSGAYRDVSFGNSQWECHWSYRSERAMKFFRNDQAANNHIVTDDPAIAKALRNIKVGDQVRLRGYLVDYATLRGGREMGRRVSSETRTDSGPGACEVLYVDELDTIRSANRRWRLAMWAGVWTMLIGLLLWFVLPVRAED
jgi:hypothetical protein